MVNKIFLLIVMCVFLVCSVYASPPYSTVVPTPTITSIPQTNFGAPFKNMTDTNFSLVYLPLNILKPIAWPLANYSFAIPSAIILFFIFAAMWRGGQNIRIPTIIGLLFGGMLLFSSGGLGLNIPAEISQISYGAIIASVAGLMLSAIKRL